MLCVSHSVVSDTLRPRECSPPSSSVHSIFPSNNTGVGCHFLPQGIFLIQGSNRGLLHCRQIFTVWATREEGMRSETWPNFNQQRNITHSLIFIRLLACLVIFLLTFDSALICICAQTWVTIFFFFCLAHCGCRLALSDIGVEWNCFCSTGEHHSLAKSTGPAPAISYLIGPGQLLAVSQNEEWEFTLNSDPVVWL